MEFCQQGSPYGARGQQPANGGLSWADAADLKRMHGDSFVPPPHMHGLSLEELEVRAAWERQPRYEVPPADGSSSAPTEEKHARYLELLGRSRSFREAAARLGVDESTVWRWRRKDPAFGARCDEIVADRRRQAQDDLVLRAGEPRARPYYFRGKQVGETLVHDDRVLMFLLRLEDGQRARAEARAAAREEAEARRAHEIRLKEMEIAARREERLAREEAKRPKPQPKPQPSDFAKRLAEADAWLLRHYQKTYGHEEAARRMQGFALHGVPPADVAMTPSAPCGGTSPETGEAIIQTPPPSRGRWPEGPEGEEKNKGPVAEFRRTLSP